MADNVDITPGAGKTVAADDVAGVLYQRIKPAFGADGSATDVALDAGLPTAWASRTITLTSVSANNSEMLAPMDASAYRSYSLHLSGTWAGTVQVQGSNDGTNYFPVQGEFLAGLGAPAYQLSSSGLYTGMLAFRYLRIRTTAYASGTVTGTVFLSAAPHITSGGSQPIYSPGTFAVTADTEMSTLAVMSDSMTNPTAGGVGAYTLSYLGNAAWGRLRTPTKFKTVAATASGSTALWTPAASTKFRLMRVLVQVTGNAATSGGAVVTVDLRDASTSTGVTFDVYVPASGGAAMGTDWSSGWVDLGNGILSAAVNNVLNINLSAALTAGQVRAVVCGTEE